MEEDAENRSTIAQKLRFSLTKITVEPALILATLASSLQDVSVKNLSLFKICTISYGYSPDICNNSSMNITIKEEIQKMESDYSLYRSYLESFPGLIVAIVLGSWSDHHNRKLPMLLVKMAYVVSSLVYLLCALFTRWPPEILFVASIVIGVTGGYTAFIVAVFSYVADSSSYSSRTLRYGLVDAAQFLSFPIGTVASGYLHKYLGFVYIFAIAAFLRLLVVVYLFCRIDTVIRHREVIPEGSSPTTGAADGGRWKEFFQWQHFRDCWQVVTRNRDGHKRCWLWLAVMTYFSLKIPVFGEGHVSFLFYVLKFNWTQVDYSNYSASGTAIAVVGLLVILPIATQKLKLSDPLLELIGDVARALNPIFVAISIHEWSLWAAQSLTVLYPLTNPALRSFVTKLVAPVEVGKVLSLEGVIEAFLSLFGGPMYVEVYNATMNTFPGAFLFLSVACSVIAVVLFTIIWIDVKQTEGYRPLSSDEDVETLT